jgi:3,4-dihydroxy 2-butanone 4-phosphate synthase/GTP cyclohydrolase II
MMDSPVAKIHTRFGPFNVIAFDEPENGTQLALWTGDLQGPEAPLVRLQSSCITSTALLGDVCDCADQISMALAYIASSNGGIFAYLNQEGRGLGLFEKICGLAMMNKGEDTVTAYSSRGLQPDVRDYAPAGRMLAHLGVGPAIRLITNNPAKMLAMTTIGFNIIERVPLEVDATERTAEYLKTKKEKLGHLLTRV